LLENSPEFPRWERAYVALLAKQNSAPRWQTYQQASPCLQSGGMAHRRTIGNALGRSVMNVCKITNAAQAHSVPAVQGAPCGSSEPAPSEMKWARCFIRKRQLGCVSGASAGAASLGLAVMACSSQTCGHGLDLQAMHSVQRNGGSYRMRQAKRSSPFQNAGHCADMRANPAGVHCQALPASHKDSMNKNSLQISGRDCARRP